MSEKPRTRVTTRERLRVVDRSVLSRARRVRSKSVYILHSTIAAGLAFWVAREFAGHPQPFFAPMAAVIILGLSGSDRLKRAMEMAVGGIMGVAVGDTLFQFVGSGPFQMTVIVLISLIVGTFLSKSQLVTNQIVIGSILIATILPPGGQTTGMDRAVDALIGSAIGILVIALIPSSPLAAGRAEISKVLSIGASVLSDVSQGLRTGDAAIIQQARDAVRGTQSNINDMLDAAKSAKETTEVSPFMWGNIRQIRSMERILEPVDNGIRGVRVLARRACVLAEDGDKVSEEQIDMIDELADVAETLSEIYARKTSKHEAQEIPGLVQNLRDIGRRAGMDVIEDDHVLSAYALLAQTRSIVVDLLQVCGMSRESALAVLVPTSEHPAYPPEVWNED